jgi:hypothetical protein
MIQKGQGGWVSIFFFTREAIWVLCKAFNEIQCLYDL